MARTSGARKAQQTQQATASTSTTPRRASRSKAFGAPKVISKRAKAILDFKQIEGRTEYLCSCENETSPSWMQENDVDASIVEEFCSTMKSQYGYTVGQGVVTSGGGASLRRSTRASKLRAFLRVHEQIQDLDINSDGEMDKNDAIGDYGEKLYGMDEEQEDARANGKRRRTAASQKKPLKQPKLRGEALKHYKIEQLGVRKKERKAWLELHPLEASEAKLRDVNCCPRCSTQAYRDAVSNRDIVQLKRLLDSPSVPLWCHEDVDYVEDGVVHLALRNGDVAMAKLLLKKAEKENFGRSSAPLNAESHYSFDSLALFRTPQLNSLNLDVKGSIHDPIHYYLALLHHPTPECEKVFEDKHTHKGKRGKLYYHAIKSGHSRIGKLCMANFVRSNSGHRLLKAIFEDDDLPSFDKDEIFYGVGRIGRLSALDCAAALPHSTHLRTLYQDVSNRYYGEFIRAAATNSTPNCLQYLLDQGHSPFLRAKYGLTPLVLAARFGRTENILLILNSAEDREIGEDKIALNYAAHFGYAETCRVLMDAGIDADHAFKGKHGRKRTPLHLACLRGHLDVVQLLVEHGHASMILEDTDGRSALHHACMGGHHAIATYLLLQGVDVDAPDKEGNTPCHFAAAFGYLSIVRLLVNLGKSDIAATNKMGTTSCAVANMKGHVAIVQFLLSCPGSNKIINYRNNKGRAMLHDLVLLKIGSAAQLEQVIRSAQLLLEHNADIHLKTTDNESVLHLLIKTVENQSKAYEMTYTKQDAVNHFRYVRFNRNTEDLLSGAYNRLVDKNSVFEKIHAVELADFLFQNGAALDTMTSDSTALLKATLSSIALVPQLIRSGANYWSARNASEQSFFHLILRSAALLDCIQLSSWMSNLEKHIKDLACILDDIISAIKAHPVPLDEATLMNSYDHDGYTPLLAGVKHAIELQNHFILRQKDIVQCFSRGKFYLGSIGNNQDPPRPVSFVFCFDHFISFSQQLFELFPPNTSAVVKLPHRYFTSYSNTVKSPADYPPYTGFSALHIASQTQNAPLLAFLLELGVDPHQDVVTVTDFGPKALAMGYFLRKTIDKDQYFEDESRQVLQVIHSHFNITMPDVDQQLHESLSVYLRFGADPCLVDAMRNSPLMKAAESYDGRAIDMMCDSIRSRGDSNLVNAKNLDGFTPLSLAMQQYVPGTTSHQHKNLRVRLEKYEWSPIASLVAIGADINALCPHGDNILMLAFDTQSLPLVCKMLMDSKHPIDHHVRNDKFETPLMRAMQSSTEVANFYVDFLQMQGNSVRQLDVLINFEDISGRTALAIAALHNHLHAVKVLCDLGADLDPTKGTRWIPLVEAVKGGAFEIVKTLLKAGASVTWTDPMTKVHLLHLAVEAQSSELVRFLLQLGADANVHDQWKRTPLHWAIDKSRARSNHNGEIEKLLLDAGANINAQDVLGRTPLHLVFTPMHQIPWVRATHKAREARIAPTFVSIAPGKRTSAVTPKMSDICSSQFAWMKTQSEFLLENSKKNETGDSKVKANEKNDAICIQNEEITSDSSDFGVALAHHVFECESTMPAIDPVPQLSQLLADTDIKLDLVDAFGRLPLHYAAVAGATSCMGLLLQSDQVDGHALDHDENGILQLSVVNLRSQCAIKALQYGARQDAVNHPCGKRSTTVLNWSLSNAALADVAKHILRNNSSVLESLVEVLADNRFTIADRLILKSKDDAALSGTTKDSKQNLWHIISNFKPWHLDAKSWDDRLDAYFAVLDRLNVPRLADKDNATPLHYAAKAGSLKIIRHLLLLEPAPALAFTHADHQSQLMLAVQSNNVEAVKILLDAGLEVCHSKRSLEQPSMLYNAVNSKNIVMVELLLKHGAPVDDDSRFGRFSPLGLACKTMDVSIVKLLIKAGANVNTVCTYQVVCNKRAEKITMPLLNYVVHKKVRNWNLIARKKELVEELLKAGAYPNCVVPRGQSCLMYCINDREFELAKLLLKHGADLGIGVPHSGRSAIFEMIYNYGNQEWVLSSMIKYCKESELSKVDKLTGMVPLEFAIRRRNRTLLDLLLYHGANPNTFSCSNAKEPGFYDEGKVNAVFHALRHANLPILETLINRTQHPIDWKAVDAKGRTVFGFLADAVDGYSIRSLDYLHCIAKRLGQLQCKEVMEIADKDGFLPTQLALKNGRPDMYDAFCKYGAKALDDSNEKLLLLPIDDAGAMDIDLSEQSRSQQPTATERRVMTTLNYVRNAKGGTREANFLGNSFRAFPNCDITEISRDAMDFRMIESYIRAPLTAYEYSYMNHMNHDKFIALEHVFSIDRHEERPPLQLQETNTRRNLLWHRFDMAKADEIFRVGLQCTPEANYMDPSVPVIEFVDVLSALSPRNVIHPPRSMFLLCEVAIGCVLSAARGVVVTSTYKSVEIPGQVGPLRTHWLRDRTGMDIPFGPPASPQSGYYTSDRYTKYVTRDASLAKMRYLVVLRNNGLCHLCMSKSPSKLATLGQHAFVTNDCKVLSELELLLAEKYLDAQAISRKEFVQHMSNAFWAEKSSFKTNSMLDDEGNNMDDAYDQLDDESIFCTSCADRIFGLMFVKAMCNLFLAADRSHSPCVPKQACRYGRSCRAMNLAMHCAKFHHWCPPTEAIAKATAPFRHDLLLSSNEIPDNGIYWPVETSQAIHEEQIHAIVATNTSETSAMAPMIPVTNDLKLRTHSVLSKRPYASCS